MSRHALFVASGDVNSDKAINLLALLDTLAPHVDVIDVRTQDPASLPAWVNGVPVFYNARLKCPGRGSHGLEQMIEEDTHMKSAGPAPAAGPAMTGATTTTMPGSMPGSMRGPPRTGHQAPSVGTVSGKGGKKASLAGVAGWASSFAKGVDRSDPKSVERMREKAMEEAIRRRDAMGDPFKATS